MSRTAPLPASSSRPIAPLPHHTPTAHQQHPQHPQQAPKQPPRTTYSSTLRELYHGPKTRLFLSLRSGIDEEVDHALPRLVVASYEHAEAFKLDLWVDSVNALKEWPEKWLDGLEKEATAKLLREERYLSDDSRDGSNGLNRNGDGIDDGASSRLPGTTKRKRDIALGAVPEWTSDPLVEQRATNSLLVLRNAACTPSNASIICRKSFLTFLDRFFSLPTSFLLDLSLRSPEPFHHILTIVQSIFPHIPATHHVRRIFGTVLPTLLVETRDQGLLNELLPLMISGLTIPDLPAPPAALIPHLLQLLVLRPAPSLLELSLDLLISFTLNPLYARSILSQPTFPQHLKSLVILLEYAARPIPVQWDLPKHSTAVMYHNPAGPSVDAERAEERRRAERAAAQGKMEMFGGPGVFGEVGDKPPMLTAAEKSKLYGMREPARSIAWMHDTFVYSSTSQLLQVTFWHAYRDFFTNPATVEQLLSASDVIKNVTIAFPGASARVIQDEMGGQKFVIAGMGFRKGGNGEHRFACLWSGCAKRHEQIASNSAQLLAHLESAHIVVDPIPARCQWASCSHAPFSISHLLTHLPLSTPVNVTDHYTSHPSVSENAILSKRITTRPIPPLPSSAKMHYTAHLTPIDSRRHPTGTAFLAALIVRNLARTLKSEISLSSPEDQAKEGAAKKKHLEEERFGLPIPDSILREEEEEEKEAGLFSFSSKKAKVKEEWELGDEERERAREGFIAVERRVLDVVEGNVSGIGQYLGEAFGW